MPITVTEYQQRYHGSIKSIRNNNNEWQSFTKNKIQITLNKSLKDLLNLLEIKGGKGVLSQALYQSKRRNILKLADDLGIKINQDIRNGISGATKRALAIQKIATELFMEKFGIDLDPNVFYGVNREAYLNTVNRVYQDGFRFSDRIWKMTQHAKTGINNILSAGIARGQDARTMTRELQRFLVNPKITPGLSWTRDIEKSTTGKGTLHYYSLRLAITEINNSYRESRALQNKKSPICSHVRWIVSSTHPKADICDIWAEEDAYGFGAGGYPPDALPIDHPMGFCYSMDILRSPEVWHKPKPKIPTRKKFDENKFRNRLAKKKISKAGINQAFKTYNQNKKLIKI